MTGVLTVLFGLAAFGSLVWLLVDDRRARRSRIRRARSVGRLTEERLAHLHVIDREHP